MGGDADGALSALPAEIRETIGQAVRISVAHGFGSALAVGAIVAAVAGALSWLLIRRVDPRETTLNVSAFSSTQLQRSGSVDAPS